MATQTRGRSSRRRTTIRRYTDDAFEEAGLDPEKSASERELDRENASDEDFLEEENGRCTAEDEAVDDFDEAGSVAGSNVNIQKGMRRKDHPRESRNAVHSRGLIKPAEHTSKPTHIKLTFGSGAEDILPAVYVRDHWASGRDSTFPSAKSLRAAHDDSLYGIGASFCHDSAKILIESTKAWDWYYENTVGGSLLQRQKVQVLDGSEGLKYVPKEKHTKHTVLTGPFGKQKAFHLGNNESFDFGLAWEKLELKDGKRGRPKKHAKVSTHSAIPEESRNGGSSMAEEGGRIREGWIINLGNKIQCIAWAPNHPGTTQYLAVAVPLLESQKTAAGDEKVTGAPAFTPSLPYPAAIQIWSFEAKKETAIPQSLDMSVKPKLRLVICSDFGDVRRLEWCPMPRKFRPADTSEEEVNIGLLAGIWGDGSVKVLDVRLRKTPPETQWIKINAPMFQAKPPSSMCTCLTWLSPSDLAIGCSDGFVGVWSLIIASKDFKRYSAPYIFAPIHTSYVLQIVAAYPAHPHLLGCSCIDGQMKMFSLLDPLVDIVEGVRMRMGTANLSYSPMFQAFVTTDEADFVRLLPARRFFSTISALRSTSSTTTLAPCSPCHPSILVGNAGGVVMATNPLRRLLNSKNKHFQQTWFSHEWVHAKDDPHDERLGASRFYDGYKAESVNLLRSATQGGLANNAIIVCENETAVTAIACNPNEQCAGWACAGTGCGLLRVEDLALRPLA
ncbi:hypothetical protein LOZ39_001059 [Ophidiomyces ophidiicola]|nr:hypothetical protein LOZ49_002463 [Ophidiomyces ophidiicola]KAI2079751.1 hypothetical protein LOZ39_001059 [Ophidiomyces ophidiicola]KAI2140190.1 hypothetical protein LOZ29_002128 [Ophidiomyces ophidiicola]KAI2142137.1 hypothetical protein LOZ28_002248 [Ophidiomyces ophidiicola]KAI2208344.1 hypothetical protein LOZ15_006627 [Ophidiomyces ophidiicola]